MAVAEMVSSRRKHRARTASTERHRKKRLIPVREALRIIEHLHSRWPDAGFGPIIARLEKILANLNPSLQKSGLIAQRALLAADQIHAKHLHRLVQPAAQSDARFLRHLEPETRGLLLPHQSFEERERRFVRLKKLAALLQRISSLAEKLRLTGRKLTLVESSVRDALFRNNGCAAQRLELLAETLEDALKPAPFQSKRPKPQSGHARRRGSKKGRRPRPAPPPISPEEYY